MKADRNRSPRICAAATVALMLSATIAHAVESAASGPAGKRTAEQVHLDTTTIKGHQGLPRVLYIVPWKRSDAGDLPGRPAASLLDEVLAPVDRAEFRRELRYSGTLNASAAP
jgi:hypothetical protein